MQNLAIMKKILILCLFILPLIGFAQNETAIISLDMEEDSTFNFLDANKSMYHLLYSNIDTSIEREIFPKEKANVRWSFSKDGNIDTVIVMSDYEDLKLEVSNALDDIDRLIIPAIKKDLNKYELILIIERWKEAGSLSISGYLMKTIK